MCAALPGPRRKPWIWRNGIAPIWHLWMWRWPMVRMDCRAAREISGRLGIPVVVCSAHATAADAHAAGASRFLMKPFGIDALAEAVLPAFRPSDSRAPLVAA